MKLLTQVDLPDYPFRMDHRTPLLFMGSCFTENIGKLMERTLFHICINPFGVTYNPQSVQRGLDALIQKEGYTYENLEKYNARWFSFDHSTAFSSSVREECLERINESFQQARQVLKEARILVLTWGTSWVYRDNTSGQVVCNCHKIPASRFTRSRLAPHEIVENYTRFLPRLFRFNPELKILLTVSPVRHWKDGAHGNQLSKASLLLATEALVKNFPGQIFYFPSYEIVMDELRDYRFYAEDLLHTNPSATEYIWEKFMNALISKESQEIIRDLEPLLKLLEHRLLNQGRKAHMEALSLREEKLVQLKEKYPFLAWEKLDLSK